MFGFKGTSDAMILGEKCKGSGQLIDFRGDENDVGKALEREIVLSWLLRPLA